MYYSLRNKFLMYGFFLSSHVLEHVRIANLFVLHHIILSLGYHWNHVGWVFWGTQSMVQSRVCVITKLSVDVLVVLCEGMRLSS